MADTPVKAADLPRPVDLASGQSHTVTVDSELHLFVSIPADASGLDLVIRDAAGREVQRLPAASLPSEGSYRSFDLRPLAQGGPYQVALHQGDRLLPPVMKLELDRVE